MALKACIFDFDGTLGDSMWVWEAVIGEYFDERSIVPEPGSMGRLAQLGMARGAADFVERYQLDESPDEVMAAWLAGAREKYATAVELKPCVREFLQQLRARGIKTAVATAQERETLILALRHEDALELFDVVLTCDEICSTGKSTPEVYWQAARRLGEQPAECLVFEDVLGPAHQAHAGGFKVVGVRDDSPAQDHDALRQEADDFINSYSELLGEFGIQRLERLLRE